MGGMRLVDLVSRFGSPLFVLSDTTLRRNFRRFKSAFVQHWPSSVEVLYAVKANPNPVVCRELANERAGFDCTGFGELELALRYGETPAITTLNGSNKSETEIAKAIAAEAIIVLDAEDDVALVKRQAELQQKIAKVILRLKAFDSSRLSGFQSDAYPSAYDAAMVVARKKWGVGYDAARGVVAQILSDAWLELQGYHLHIGRLTRRADIVAANAAAFGRLVVDINRSTGFQPALIDIGGGWAGDRDPEARTGELNADSIENYAECVCAALRAVFEDTAFPLPSLWLEPGRYLVNNAGLLLATVGCIKRDEGCCWVNVDASGEWLVLTTLHGAENVIVPVVGLERTLSETADVVGPNCIPAVFGKSKALPPLSRGEVLAILDAGAYAESQASQFNSMPRPATALIREKRAYLITRRETYENLFARFEIPAF